MTCMPDKYNNENKTRTVFLVQLKFETLSFLDLDI